MHTLPSSFLFPIIIYHCENCQFQANNVPRQGKINPKRGRERHILKKVNENLKILDLSLVPAIARLGGICSKETNGH